MEGEAVTSDDSGGLQPEWDGEANRRAGVGEERGSHVRVCLRAGEAWGRVWWWRLVCVAWGDTWRK